MKPMLWYPAFALLLASLSHAQPSDGGTQDFSGSGTSEESTQPGEQAPSDRPAQSRFWEAAIGESGHYMVALDRISSISRHQYILNGNALVDEVTIDSVGQSLARFYHIRPLTDAADGAPASAASRIIERGRELVDQAAGRIGTKAHEMVVKTYPDTTHARSIEYRILSASDLEALHKSMRTAWESGKGRKFIME